MNNKECNVVVVVVVVYSHNLNGRRNRKLRGVVDKRILCDISSSNV